MVQPCRVDPPGHGAILLSDPRLWGPSGFGPGRLLEARRMASPSRLASFVSGHFVHGALPRQPSAAPGQTTRPLLRRLLREVYLGAADRHGAGAGTGSPFHAQKEKVVQTAGFTSLTSKDGFWSTL